MCGPERTNERTRIELDVIYWNKAVRLASFVGAKAHTCDVTPPLQQVNTYLCGVSTVSSQGRGVGQAGLEPSRCLPSEITTQGEMYARLTEHAFINRNRVPKGRVPVSRYAYSGTYCTGTELQMETWLRSTMARVLPVCSAYPIYIKVTHRKGRSPSRYLSPH